MYALAPEMTADQVLQAFHHDALNLFLGAAIVAVGLVAAAFSAIRRKLDPVLIYFALFALLYGLRMWMQSHLMVLTMQSSPLYARLTAALDFATAIPAFFFFKAAGVLRRHATVLSNSIGIVLGSLGLATFIFGPHRIFYQLANISIIVALVVVIPRSIMKKSDNQDLLVIRPGLLIFLAFVLWENIRNAVGLQLPNIEPIGFVVLLGTLGYVAARQTLQRDRQLSEIQKELEVARRIQLSILPAVFPNSRNFRVAARYVPMNSVAGDFYDFIVGDETQAGLLIADVSGHGVPAALIASMVKVAATAQRANAADPAGLLAGMNAVLCGNTQNQFVTAAYVYLDAASKTFRYSAAGHPPMLLLRKGEVTEIVENGLILAAFDYATYTNATQPLRPGDRFLVYTDGVIEAANANGDFFGKDALSALLRQTSQLPPSRASDEMVSALRRWSASQEDDLTVLICDYMPVQ
jgi:sigma-B regulation protein RsbU (phosphoserine phosphatase)